LSFLFRFRSSLPFLSSSFALAVSRKLTNFDYPSLTSFTPTPSTEGEIFPFRRVASLRSFPSISADSRLFFHPLLSSGQILPPTRRVCYAATLLAQPTLQEPGSSQTLPSLLIFASFAEPASPFLSPPSLRRGDPVPRECSRRSLLVPQRSTRSGFRVGSETWNCELMKERIAVRRSLTDFVPPRHSQPMFTMKVSDSSQLLYSIWTVADLLPSSLQAYLPVAESFGFNSALVRRGFDPSPQFTSPNLSLALSSLQREATGGQAFPQAVFDHWEPWVHFSTLRGREEPKPPSCSLPLSSRLGDHLLTSTFFLHSHSG